MSRANSMMANMSETQVREWMFDRLVDELLEEQSCYTNIAKDASTTTA